MGWRTGNGKRGALPEPAVKTDAEPGKEPSDRSLEIDEQWSRSLVELGGVTYEPGAAEEAMGPPGAGLDTGYDKPA